MPASPQAIYSHGIFWGERDNILHYNSFEIWDGTTLVTVPAGSLIPGIAPSWIEVTPAGAVSFNLVGFTPGRIPLARAHNVGLTGPNYLIGVELVYHALVTAGSGGGGGGASATEPYVTIGSSAGLTAERALQVTAPLELVDGGPNSNVTLSHRNVQELPDAHHLKSHAPADHTKEIAQTYLPFGSAGINGYAVVL
jgi:hypothetical protein